MAVAIIVAACSKNKDDNKSDKEDSKPVVKVEAVSERSVDQTSEYTATVEADKLNNISSSTPNRIKEILVDEGQRVSKGQRLVVLDDVNTTAYQIQVDNARANLANIRLDYNRALELYKIGGGTKQAVDQMQTQMTNAANNLAAAERTLKNVSENTVLTSPINGVVTVRNYDPGDMTGSSPILTIAQIQPVKVVINVSETELSKVRQGMPATVTFDTYGDEKFSGFVTKILPTVDTQNRTFGLEISLPNSDSKILPGMFARVTINFGSMNHVVVPDRAVVKQPGSGNHYVYIYKNGRVEYSKVELGRRLDDAYEIISGVQNGDLVVVSGQSKLANGMAVTLAK